MLSELYGIVAVEVVKRAATKTLFVKMRAATAVVAGVLIEIAAALITAKTLDGVGLTELVQAAVKTAASLFGTPVQLTAELVDRELAVGVLREELEQLLPSLGFVGGSCHRNQIFLAI